MSSSVDVMPVAIVLAFAGGFLLALWATGSRREDRARAAQLAHVVSAATARSLPPDEELRALPAPVARYLRWALTEAPPIRHVRLTQAGTLRTDVRSPRWMAFEAQHVASPDPPGFVWNARVAVAPLLHVRVRDSYVGGEGSGHVALLSAVTVGANAGTPQMNAGSLHRFLAEAVWYPTALLPGPALQWTGIDANRALATLTDHRTTVSLEFRFAGSGEVTGIYTPARWGTFAGGYEQRPWEGHFRSYQRRDGVLVPTEGEVGWYADGAYMLVWKGTITAYRVEQG